MGDVKATPHMRKVSYYELGIVTEIVHDEDLDALAVQRTEHRSQRFLPRR